MERLATWGVPTAGVSLVDGSGLSDANRLTCAAILGVLEHGSATDAVGQGMPVAGATGGTLFDVFTEWSARRQAARQDRHAEPELQPGSTRRQVARRLRAARPAGARSSSCCCRTASASPTTTSRCGTSSARRSARIRPARPPRRSRRGDRSMAVMPMFPLGMVLLPGVVLPLHVFEPRYQQLVRDCLDAPTARVRRRADRSRQRGRRRRHAI